MAVSKIPRRGMIRLFQGRDVYIGTSSTQVKFNYSIPSDYTLVSAEIMTNYVLEVVGGIEEKSRTSTSGYYKITTSGKTIHFNFMGLAVPTELLRTI